MQRIHYDDFVQFLFLSDPAFSPDGSRVVFAGHKIDLEEDRYRSGLYSYCLADGKVTPLTSYGDERSFFFAGKDVIYFSSGREKKAGAAPSTTYYRLDLNGGEAQKAFTIPTRVSSISPIDEDTFLVLTPRDISSEEKPAPGQPAAQPGKDYLILDEIPFWANGFGFKSKIRSTVMLYHRDTGVLEQISPKEMNVSGAHLNKAKDKIVYFGPVYDQQMPRLCPLHVYDLNTRTDSVLLADGKMAVSAAHFLGDEVVFAASDDMEGFSCSNPKLYLGNPATLQVRLLADEDLSIGTAAGSDSMYGGGGTMAEENGKLYFMSASWGNTFLYSVDAAGKVEQVTTVGDAIRCFALREGKVAYVGMHGSDLNELFLFDLATGEDRQLTHLNQWYTDSHEVSRPEYFRFANRDGIEQEGWVIKPYGYDPAKKYPGVMEMHGGPKAVFGGVYFHEMQALAAQGYFVFFTNPRGSDGRGSAFADIRGKFGDTDYHDFLDFADEVIRRYPALMPDKIGICGGSYGGFMCNWMISRTHRFAAAASQRSISNYVSKILCCDNGFIGNLNQMTASPWEDMMTIWNQSPISGANTCTTPTLFIQSDEDYRCWMIECMQMYTALKRKGVPSKIVLFHGDNHELSRSGRPTNRLARLHEIIEWFNIYLHR